MFFCCRTSRSFTGFPLPPTCSRDNVLHSGHTRISEFCQLVINKNILGFIIYIQSILRSDVISTFFLPMVRFQGLPILFVYNYKPHSIVLLYEKTLHRKCFFRSVLLAKRLNLFCFRSLPCA